MTSTAQAADTVSSTQSFVRSGFGSSRAIPSIDFVIFGLLTFWVYTVLRIERHLRAHFTIRWSELEQIIDTSSAQDLHNRGFISPTKSLFFAAVLFTLSGVFVISWFLYFVMYGDASYKTITVAIAGLSSMLFYCATVLSILVVANALRAHEITESMIRTLGAQAIEQTKWIPSDAMVARWERLFSKVGLFCVLALPMVFSPTVVTNLYFENIDASAAYHLMLIISCFIFAGLYHVYGTSLLIGLFNAHLEYEAENLQQAAAEDIASKGTSEIDEIKERHRHAIPRRQLITIMLTDIVGYSKAMQHDENAAYELLLEHNRIMRGVIADHHGREIKTIGDAFLVVFESAIDSVDCAIAMQHSLAEFNADKPLEEKIQIRIGIHLGDVIVTENDVYGDGVNIAARIEPLAEPGGICISQDVYSLVKKKLSLEIKRLDDVKLKNIILTPDIYSIRVGV